MHARFATWRAVVACLAAYVLLWQGLLGAVALGAQALPGTAAFGDVICFNSPDGETGEAPADRKTHVPDCCRFGCPMLGTPAVPLPEAVVVPPLAPPCAIGRLAVPPVSPQNRPGDTPSRARAPPPVA